MNAMSFIIPKIATSEVKKGMKIKVIMSDKAFAAAACAELCVRCGLAHIEAVYPKFTNASHVEQEK